MKYIILLKIYFFILLGVLGAFLVQTILEDELLTFLDYIEYIFEFVLLLGIFGYAFDKKIFVKKFWQIFLFLIIIWHIFYLINTIDVYEAAYQTLMFFSFFLAYFLFFIPGYMALYLYGYSNEPISVKRNAKVVLLVFFSILVSNIIIYKIAHKDISMKNFLAQTRIDAMMLKSHENNDSKLVDIFLPAHIQGFFKVAGEVKNDEIFLPMCREFDLELFTIMDEYDEEMKIIYKDIYDLNSSDDFMQQHEEFEILISKGKEKIRNLCNVSQ